MKPLLAILIPTLYSNQPLFQRVYTQLRKQMSDDRVVILSEIDDGTLTTGAKRNLLLDKAREVGAKHISFVDDDDLVGPTYVQRGIETAEGDYDCAELWGQYYENNKKFNPFHHSIIHDHWWQDDKFYYRNPNHLNFIKLDLLKNIRFQDKTIGEDAHYSIDIQKEGLLKKEYPIKEIIYYYFAGKKNLKDHAMEPVWAEQRGITL